MKIDPTPVRKPLIIALWKFSCCDTVLLREGGAFGPAAAAGRSLAPLRAAIPEESVSRIYYL